MGFKIVWSPKSEQTFDKIISYLAKNWTEKEIKHLTLETERVIHLLKQNPYIFRGSEKHDINEVLITKHNLLLYQISKRSKIVVLLSFFDTRKDSHYTKSAEFFV